MKKYLLLILLIPSVLSAFDASGDYAFDYFYFYKMNYFSAHTLTGVISNESGFVKFYGQFYGRFYNGDSRYIINYPDIDLTSIGFVPPAYIQLKNEVEVSQLYLSFFLNSFSIKVGKIPLKWGISEIYSPADIFSREIPFNVYSIKTGVNGLNASYSSNNLTLSFIFQDGTEYEETKQGLAAEFMSGYVTAKIYGAHFFKEQVNLLARDTVENLMTGVSFISDYLGPGVWLEGDLFSDERNKRLYITAGFDYTLFDRVYVLAEGFVNLSGADAPYSDLAHINRLLNGDFLMGKYYLFSNVILNRGEKIEFDFVSALNMDDLSSIGGLLLRFIPKTYVDFSIGAVGTTGESREEFFKVPFISYFEIKYSF